MELTQPQQQSECRSDSSTASHSPPHTKQQALKEHGVLFMAQKLTQSFLVFLETMFI